MLVKLATWWTFQWLYSWHRRPLGKLLQRAGSFQLQCWWSTRQSIPMWRKIMMHKVRCDTGTNKAYTRAPDRDPQSSKLRWCRHEDVVYIPVYFTPLDVNYSTLLKVCQHNPSHSIHLRSPQTLWICQLMCRIEPEQNHIPFFWYWNHSTFQAKHHGRDSRPLHRLLRSNGKEVCVHPKRWKGN